jgi:hypothetical protein
MRTGEEVNIGSGLVAISVRRHASFCSQARRHRPLFSQRAPPLRVPVWVIPPYTPGSPGHPAIIHTLLRTRRILPLPQPLSLFPLFFINITPVSFLPTLFPYYDLSRCFFQRF